MVIICDRHDVLLHNVLKNMYQFFRMRQEQVTCYNFSNLSDLVRLLRASFSDDAAIIFQDPLVALGVFLLKPASIRKGNYFCLEMWGYDAANSSMKISLRNIIFKLSNRIALKLSPISIFSNELRRQFYIDKAPHLRDRSYTFENYYMKKKAGEEILPCSMELQSKLAEIKNKHKVITCFAGAIQRGRNVPMLASVVDSSPFEICLVVAGEDRIGIPWSSFTKGNVYYLGALSQEEVTQIYSIAQWGFMDYDNSLLNTRYCSPLKLYEYLAHGLGIICNRNYAMLLKRNLIDYYYENEEDLSIILRKLIYSKPCRKNVKDFDFSQKFDKLLLDIKYQNLSHNSLGRSGFLRK